MDQTSGNEWAGKADAILAAVEASVRAEFEPKIVGEVKRRMEAVTAAMNGLREAPPPPKPPRWPRSDKGKPRPKKEDVPPAYLAPEEVLGGTGVIEGYELSGGTDNSARRFHNGVLEEVAE